MTQTHIGGCGCLRPATTVRHGIWFASPPHCCLTAVAISYRSRRAQTAVSLALRRAPARWYSRTGAVSARRAASLARCVARSFSSRVRRLAVRHSECTYMVVLHKYMLIKKMHSTRSAIYMFTARQACTFKAYTIRPVRRLQARLQSNRTAGSSCKGYIKYQQAMRAVPSGWCASSRPAMPPSSPRGQRRLVCF